MHHGKALIRTQQVGLVAHPKTGVVEHQVELPQQHLRRYDSPWLGESFSVGNDQVVLKCYEDLFCVDIKLGKVLWNYDAGFFGAGAVLVDGDRVYVTTRIPAQRELQKNAKLKKKRGK